MKIRKAVFPVAGLGTRFLPATKAMPKEMLPIVDKPLIQYAVEEAVAAGIEQIIFVTGQGKTALEDHFDKNTELENILKGRGKTDLLHEINSLVPSSGSIVYTRQSEPLGLGHAIWCAREIVGDEPFAVLLADDLIQADKPVLAQMIDEFDRLRASMAAVINVDRDQTDKYGILDTGAEMGKVVTVKGLVEKPAPADAPSNLAIIGRYILTPRIFDLLGRKQTGAGGEIQLTDAMSALLDTQPIYGYKFEGQRFDCGDKAGFQMANLAFAMERPELQEKMLPFLLELCQMNTKKNNPAD
ncbi:MAG: UTP--glucose-1-phosphate uridylyltransferase GalU [Desulfobulbaceae bacterium]|nr:UTP--glucose-1-phosphate uridylyltransferase GalU [Desulfobulbaceae bacterium]